MTSHSNCLIEAVLKKGHNLCFYGILFTVVTQSLCIALITAQKHRGWSGAKVLGKLSVLGHPSGLDNSRARAYCT